MVGVEGANGTLFGKLLRCGALSGEIEDENLEPAEKSPNCFVIVGYSGITQIRPEGLHESAHVIVGRAWPLNAVKEGWRGEQLSRPG